MTTASPRSSGCTASQERACYAAFGPGSACRNELCERYGFTGDDFYYPIGRETGKGVGQLPWLMIGLDPRGRVARVFTLTTH